MELCVFHTRIYGKHSNHIYLFEPTWDSFRPISKLGWDGKKFSAEEMYKSNLFSPIYGFESLDQKTFCREIVETTDLEKAKEVVDPVEFWRWAGMSDASWFRDRPCVFLNQCSPKNWKEYLGYIGSRSKTLRNPPRGRVTRRLVRRLTKV